MAKNHLIEIGGLVLLVVVLLVIMGLNIGGNRPGTLNQPTTPPPPAVTITRITVEIIDFRFIPETITVKPGEKIAIFNKDQVEHTLTSDDRKSFDTGKIAQNQTAILTAPETPGNYSFYSLTVPSTKGTLVVQKQP